MPIGGRARRECRTDGPARTAAIVDDHRLAKCLSQPVGDYPSQDVAGTAGFKWDDQSYGPMGIVLRVRCWRKAIAREQEQTPGRESNHSRHRTASNQMGIGRIPKSRIYRRRAEGRSKL